MVISLEKQLIAISFRLSKTAYIKTLQNQMNLEGFLFEKIDLNIYLNLFFFSLIIRYNTRFGNSICP